jgi:glutamate--cysteine ligase
VSKNFEQTLDFLVSKGIDKHLSNLQRGLEKESLRVNSSGLLAQTPHPHNLGSTLTHPMITTDYSESLLEFVTPVHNNIQNLLKQLHDIHHFTYQHIGDEKLWVNSMPCIVESEEKIPIARYGISNIAQMKEAYRRGLSHRYGSLMQTIAGIHFNFSMPEAFWKDYLETDSNTELQSGKSSHYFSLIRNFHRHSWIAIYLFGASPAVCRSFLRGREHMLEDFDAHSFFAPNATSLRLSGLGYSNEAQADIEICYNGVDEFVKSLRKAIQTVNPEYKKFGINVGGEFQQLNANLLQIENEFYSSIRPKRVTASGESPTMALQTRGVEYVEVRSIDLNPFVPVGIHADCIRFMDTLLLYCMFSSSDQLSPEEFRMSKTNQHKIVMEGRDSGIAINTLQGERVARTEMVGLLKKLRPMAELLDQVNNTTSYMETMQQQFNKIEDSDLTPSARIINQMLQEDLSFYEFSMMMSKRTEQLFKQDPLDPAINAKFEDLAQKSHADQLEIEKSDKVSFDEFLDDYFARQNSP